MNRDSIIKFFSSLTLPSNSTDEQDAVLEELGEKFNRYIWGDNGLSEKFANLRYENYGKDLKLILFQCNVFPDDMKKAALQKIENYITREKAIGVNIIVDEAFFELTESERNAYLISEIENSLESIRELYEEHLDTNFEMLIKDVHKSLVSKKRPEQVKVTLQGMSVEHKKTELFKKFGRQGTRWFASVTLNLFDNSNKQHVAEWFYLIACSPEYKSRPFKSGPKFDEKYFIVQKQFDLNELKILAKSRLDEFSADDWDEFYEKMEERFCHED